MVGSLLSISMAPNIYLLPFLVAMFVYSTNRLTDIMEDSKSHPPRTQFVIKNYTLMKFVNIISFVLVIIFSLLHSFLTLLIICIPMILVIIYSVKLLPSYIFQKSRLKEYFLMKNIIVSIGWALIPVYVSVYTGVITPWIFLVSLFIFFRIFIGVIMFDLRDIHGDKIYKIDSIPIRFGEKRVKNLSLY
ncbi:MAG: UbiA family prenyltransferase [Candidatus Aenigmatarchaeota archaeon]